MVEVDGLRSHISTLVPGGERASCTAMVEYKVFKSHSIVLVYSISSRVSFDHIKDYLELVHRAKGSHFAQSQFPIILVGNKCDLGDHQERQVQREEGENLARTLGLLCGFREVSAKTWEGIDETFSLVV